MKLSARNQLKGTVVEIQDGAVNGIVKIDLGGGNVISAVITMNETDGRWYVAEFPYGTAAGNAAHEER